MNSHEPESENDRDDPKRWAALLGSVQRHAAPPDPAILEEIGRRSADVFANVADADLVSISNDHQLDPIEADRYQKRAGWFYGGAAALAVMMAGIWLVARPVDVERPMVLGDALRQLVADDAVKLRVTSAAAGAAQVWIAGDRLRWDVNDGVYKIAAGERMWLVNEPKNQVLARESPYYHGGQIDVLSLLELMDATERDRFIRQEPAGSELRDNRDCYRFISTTSDKVGPVSVEAWVDAATNELAGIEAHRVIDGRREVVAAVEIVARNQPIDDRLFVVGDTLTADGRVGK